MKNYINIFFYILISLFLFQACDSIKSTSYPNKGNSYQDNPEILKAGKELFLENCATCHGDNGAGFGNQRLKLEDKPADLYLIAASNTIEDIAKRISSGKGHTMPGFNEALSDDDIWKIANFVKSL